VSASRETYLAKLYLDRTLAPGRSRRGADTPTRRDHRSRAMAVLAVAAGRAWRRLIAWCARPHG
jgi:hypothetical protein